MYVDCQFYFQLSRFRKDVNIAKVGLPFNVFSIPPNPKFAFTSIQYGASFSLFFDGIKSTPASLHLVAFAILIDSEASRSVNSNGSALAPN